VQQVARPYLLVPKDAMEAVYGKAVLLTDTMIAQLLQALNGAVAQTDEGKEALEALWQKLFDAWDDDCPYEGDCPDN
jgi:hypothetical protein